jgi:exopolyphosphatase/guanosine-5'-triphosphate,3'-diphosphate pyrophosphatase
MGKSFLQSNLQTDEPEELSSGPPYPASSPLVQQVSPAPLKVWEGGHETVGVADFGSNSTRLVLLNVHPDGSYKLMDELREPLRLSEHLDDEGRLTSGIIERTVETARVFMQFSASQNVSRMICVATSALREAKNGREVLNRVQDESGMHLDILSGEQEAFYGYIGVVKTLNVPNGFLIDVGGGSAEVVRLTDRTAAEMTSLPLGAITLTDHFLDRDKSASDPLRRLEKYLAETYESIPWIGARSRENGSKSKPSGKKNKPGKEGATEKDSGGVLVGLGGTARTIGKIYKRKIETPLDLLHGLSIPIAELQAIYDDLKGKSLAQRVEIPGLSPARADIIVGGVAAICGLAQAIGASELVVSGRGLRDGLFFSHLLPDAHQNASVEDPALLATNNLMRYYDVGESHSRHIASLALALFDRLAPLHGFGLPERRLLKIAALLHDVGIAVNYYNHGAHGFYLLTHTGIDGLTHRELVIVAFLVAFHANESSPLKRWPDHRMLLDSSDEETVNKLGILLKVCESLDRSESGNVREIACDIKWDGTEITLKPTLIGNGEFELRDVQHFLPDFERAFAVRVHLEPQRI